jgi:hypothetical protein
MVASRNRQILIGAIVGGAALVGYQIWSRSAATPASRSNGNAAARRVDRATASPAAAPAVHLHALEAARPNPLARDRNLFRFKPKALPPPPPPPVASAPSVPPPPPAAPPPPRLAPIPYKFMGIVEAPDRSLTIAVLSDGVHAPFFGRVGELVEGRYRILRIGPDSVEMAYPDGRGRQTIRLTGS